MLHVQITSVSHSAKRHWKITEIQVLRIRRLTSRIHFAVMVKREKME